MRNASLHAAADTYRAICANPQAAPALMRALLVALLPPQSAVVYGYCQEYQPVTADAVKREYGISAQYASSLLAELADIGLLEREAVSVDGGKPYYEYRETSQLGHILT